MRIRNLPIVLTFIVFCILWGAVWLSEMIWLRRSLERGKEMTKTRSEKIYKKNNFWNANSTKIRRCRMIRSQGVSVFLILSLVATFQLWRPDYKYVVKFPITRFFCNMIFNIGHFTQNLRCNCLKMTRLKFSMNEVQSACLAGTVKSWSAAACTFLVQLLIIVTVKVLLFSLEISYYFSV